MFSFEELNAKINRLKREGGVGYTEPGKSITWDGNTDGKVVILDAIVQMSTEPIDLSSIKSISYTTFNGESHTVDAEHEAVKIETNGLLQLLAIADEPAVFVCLEEHQNETFGEYFPKGTYFVKLSTNYTSAIQCAETIHPISDKYLPAPVVIDMPIGIDVLLSGTPIPVDDALAAKLEGAAEKHAPVDLVVDNSTDTKILQAILRFNCYLKQVSKDSGDKELTFSCYYRSVRYEIVYTSESGTKTITGSAA